MGYCMVSTNIDIKIKSSNEEAALNALKTLAKKKNLMWIEEEYIINSSSLNEALLECRYESYTSNEFLIIESFCGEKLGDDELIFETLAPFIESEGYITFRGEDGDQWRYKFKDGKLKEQNATIYWK